MKVEVHFRFKENDTSILDDAIGKAHKSFSSFFKGNKDYGGYGCVLIENNIWCLVGDAIFIFKVLSILSDKYRGLDNILAVDVYRDGLKYLALKSTDKHKFRFRTPYYINVFSEELNMIIRDREGPYTYNEAMKEKEFHEKYLDDNALKETLEIIKGVPGIESE